MEEARTSNLKHRPIGLGVQGLADAFIHLRMPFDSDEARVLNREIFAEGQAYVALSRDQKLSQLHLWCLHRDALKGYATVDAEYVRLALRPLTDDAIAAAPRRMRVRHLLPLARA